MRRKRYVHLTWILGLAALLSGCGSSSSSNTSTTAPPTGLTKRVLVSNETANFVNIFDGKKDVRSLKTIGATSPTKMVTAGGQTAILEASVAQVTIFNNATEATTFQPLLADIATDVVITPDGKTVWVAERNNGFVQYVDTATGIVTISVPVPSAHRLVLSPTGTKLLVFSDDPQALVGPITTPNIFQNAFFVIDTATASTNPQATPILLSPGDQPFSAVFGTSETQAIILNCGSGCGGNSGPPSTTPTSPSVMTVDFTNAAAPGLGAHVPVPAATTGLLSNSNLFIAGTTSPTAAVSPGTGFLQVLNSSSLAPVGPPVQITDGQHLFMVLMSNNHLYIAGAGCTPGPVLANSTRVGCLSIANVGNPAAPTVTFPAEDALRQNFDVTGVQPISARSVVYVVQGGELDFFNVNTDNVDSTITPIDIVGLAFGVVQIDP